MQAPSYPVQHTQRMVQPMEIQHRPPGVLAERIDPVTLQYIRFLFPSQFEGMKFLALLCRRATEKQRAMFQEPVAVITFHGVAALCKAPDWEWGYHATLRYFILFEALGILQRLRRNGTTEVHIPLGVRTEPLNREYLLQSLDDLQQKHNYKDKKLTQLIARVRNQIEVYNIGAFGDAEGWQMGQPDLTQAPALQERLIAVMRAERIPLTKCQRIAQWLCTSQIPHLLRDDTNTTQLPATQQLPAQEGDSETPTDKKAMRVQCILGDSEKDTLHTNSRQEGDSQNNHVHPQQDNQQANTTKNRPEKRQRDILLDPPVLSEQPKSPNGASSAVDKSLVGDSDQPLSSKRSLFSNKVSKKDRIDIEDTPDATSTVSPSGDSLRAEATWIASELDGEESLKLNHGRGWVGAYKSKLQEHPYLVRVSLIDMYMQRVFPDWRGQPYGRGGQWFNMRYKAYVTGQEAVPAEIESWARAPYSYEQIKKALNQERHRQEQEITELLRRAPFSVHELRRPFADCVHFSGVLGDSDGDHQLVGEEKTENDAIIQQTDHQITDLESVEKAIEEEGVEMEDGTWLSLEAYQQLQDRTLFAMLSDWSPEADDSIQDYIESVQYTCLGKEEMGRKLSHVPYNVCRSERQLQHILPSDLYGVEVQVTPRGHFAIEVRALDDPTNAHVMYTTQQTEEFIRWFMQR